MCSCKCTILRPRHTTMSSPVTCVLSEWFARTRSDAQVRFGYMRAQIRGFTLILDHAFGFVLDVVGEWLIEVNYSCNVLLRILI